MTIFPLPSLEYVIHIIHKRTTWTLTFSRKLSMKYYHSLSWRENFQKYSYEEESFVFLVDGNLFLCQHRWTEDASAQTEETGLSRRQELFETSKNILYHFLKQIWFNFKKRSTYSIVIYIAQRPSGAID